MSEGEFPAAAGALREALDLRREDRLIASLLVEALSGASETDSEAIREIERIVEEDPDFLQARLAVAQSMSRSGDLEGAVELLEAAPEQARGNVEYLRLLSFAYYRTGRVEKALESTDRWLRRRPEDEQGRYLRAVVLSAVGRESEAESQLSGLVAEDPERLEWSLALADLLDRQGRRDEAADILRALIERLEDRGENEDRLRAAGLLAQMLARSGDWNGVLRVVERMQSGASLAAGDPLTLLKADALEKTGRIDEALSVLEDVGSDDRLGDLSLGKRAEILFRAGRTEEAESAIAGLIGTEDVDRLIVAARSLQAVDLFARSVPILTRAVELDSGRLEGLFLLGAAFERSEEVEKAEATFRRLLDLDENFTPALNYLGYMWADRGVNLDEALVLVQRAVALEPNNAAYLDSLGWAYFRKGRYEEAIEPLERAAQLVGEDPVVFDHLGDLYRELGRSEDAAEAYRRAIGIGGAENEAEIRRKLEELTRR
jgi:tetratricopeptide (TPR) repeat protein